jgi:hypothetical protein
MPFSLRYVRILLFCKHDYNFKKYPSSKLFFKCYKNKIYIQNSSIFKETYLIK